MERACEVDTNHYDAHYNLGVLLQQLGRPEEAITTYEKARKINPNRVEVLNNLGGLYEKKGELDKALELLEAALKMDSTKPSLYNNLGNAQLKKGRIREAIPNYQKALEYARAYGDPPKSFAPLHSNLGICFYHLGEEEKAIREWQTSLRLNPGYLPAYYHLAQAYEEREQIQEARNLWRRVLELTPKNAQGLRALERLR